MWILFFKGGQSHLESSVFESVFVFAIVLLEYAAPWTDTARDPHIWTLHRSYFVSNE